MFEDPPSRGDMSYYEILELKQRLRTAFNPDIEREIMTIMSKVASIDRRLETLECRVKYLGKVEGDE